MVRIQTAPPEPTPASRRQFLRTSLFTAGALAIANSPLLGPLAQRAEAAADDLVRETLNGFLAFIVPGPDQYSKAQGVTATDLGGVNANVAEFLIQTLDLSVPFLPQFSAMIAATLNQLAQAVNPSATSPFSSPFANLQYAEKVAVLQIMDRTDALKPLGGVLPAFFAFAVYSDAGTFDPAPRTITGTPVGWTISNYSGVSDGRDEFQGYFQNRRSAERGRF